MQTRISATAADQVHTVLRQHMQVDGYDFVLDLEKSQGRRIVDQRNGRTWLDMFSCYATMPIGFNHPGMLESEFSQKLLRAATANPTNSDVYTTDMADFVDTFSRLAMPAYLPHLFLVSGGTLAVENALKVAFDWKVRKNFQRGYTKETGHQVIHFTGAFHGRSGYALSLTNTADPRKHQNFPKFNWPRVVHVPAVQFPLDEEEYERIRGEEQAAIDQIKSIFRVRGDDIACIIIEPIQGEGGDNHFRPEFLRSLRQLADEHDVLLIFDEIQTGMGLTGKMWAHQHACARPDILVFGKKTQVCGIMVGDRIDQDPDNVFRTPSRINSTWGGNLADMVRCQRFLEIMVTDNLLQNATITGQKLENRLHLLQQRYRITLSNARGLGLMCAIDLADTGMRNTVIDGAFRNGLIVLPCGQRSIRFRPPLDVTEDEVIEAGDILDGVIAQYTNR